MYYQLTVSIAAAAAAAVTFDPASQLESYCQAQ
jgi:hypothetical protein